MQGLLDDPRTLGLLSLGMRLMSTPGKFGSALGTAGLGAVGDMLGATQQQRQQKRQAEQDAMQRAQFDAQQAALRRDLERQTGIDNAYSSAVRTNVISPVEQATAGGGGPSLENAAKLPSLTPQTTQTFDQQALINNLLRVPGGGPEALKLIEQFRKSAPKLESLAGDATGFVWDGSKFVQVATNPKPVKATKSPLAQLLSERDELPPGSPWAPVYRDAITKASTQPPAPSASVVMPPQESEFVRGQGKAFSDVMDGINKQGFDAPIKLRRLERMEQLLDGVDGGKLAPLGLEVASWANSVGIKMDPKTGNKEAAQALAREIAATFRVAGTGPMTDKDFDNFLLQVPDLSKTAEGRKQITKTMRAAANRDIALSKMAREYVKKNKKLDDGFLEEAAMFMAENPVVGSPEGWRRLP
jgi:hypothetical protein